MTASADSRISDERLDGLTTLLQGAMSRIDADDMVEVPADYLRGAVLVFAELHQARALIGKVRDVLEAIQYGSRNCIKEHGQKTVNELATVGLIYLDDATPITELRERRAQAAAVKPLEWREIDRAAWLGLRIESGPYVIQQYKNGDGSLRTDLFDVFKNDTGRAVYRATGLGEAKLWASFDAALAAPPPAQVASETALQKAAEMAPPAGDDLVARLEALARDFEPRPDNAPVQGGRIARLAREAIEALTSQQHTEPVAGEVEVVAWRWRAKVNGEWSLWSVVEVDPNDWTWRDYWQDLEIEPVVRKSSYDALAAAKDAETAKRKELLDRCVRLNNRAEAAEASLEAIERQRDALREALLVAKDAANSFRDESGDAVADQVIVRIVAALKDEGSAR